MSSSDPRMSCGSTAPSTSTSICWSAGSARFSTTFSRTVDVTSCEATHSPANQATTARTSTPTTEVIQTQGFVIRMSPSPAGSGRS